MIGLLFGALLACVVGPFDSGDTGAASAPVVFDLPNLVLGKRIEAAGAASLRCTGENGDDIELDGGSPFVVLGLVAETAYTCAVDGLDEVGSASVGFTTEALPDFVPTDLSVEGSSSSYTLLNYGWWSEPAAQHAQLLIVDGEGQVRWYLDESAGGLDPAMDTYATFLPEGVFYGGAMGLPPTVVSLDGSSATALDDGSGGLFHHDAVWLPSGGLLTLAEVENAEGPATWKGFELAIWVAGAQTWTWNSQRLTDDGSLAVPPPGVSDPWHANGLTLLDGGATILVSLNELDRLLALDVATGEVLWTLGGDRGDFELVAGTWFGNQHAPEMVSETEGGFSFLLYDNSNGTGTRAVRYDVDLEGMTASQIWEWTEPGSVWLEPTLGDVDLLPDGGVLVTEGHCAWCEDGDGVTVNADDRSAIVEVAPDGSETWALRFGEAASAVYRAERIDGCSIFRNGRFCL